MPTSLISYPKKIKKFFDDTLISKSRFIQKKIKDSEEYQEWEKKNT